MLIRPILFVLYLILNAGSVCAQKDTLILDTAGRAVTKGVEKLKDTARKYNPNKAVIRSALIPGWGQVTNKKIWKVPIVAAALGITGGIFFRNLKQYRDAKAAYILATDNNPDNDIEIKQPYYSVRSQPERIRSFRNEVRQNVDYSVLFFLAFWGLNVADAAVDAHLKTFDVSDDLSFRIKAGYSPLAQTNGISFVLHIGK